MNRQIWLLAIAVALMLGHTAAQDQIDLDALDDKLQRHLEKKMPGWQHKRVEPIQGSRSVLIQTWSISNRAERIALTLLMLVGITPQAFGQEVTTQKPNEAEVAAAKRQLEILRYPSGVITIRLAALGREPATTPPPYTVDNWMHFQMFESQNSGADLMCWDDRNPYYAYRPELIRDGDILSYPKRAKEFVARAEREPAGDGFSRAPETMISGREYPSRYVQLEDWYETPLKPGHYQ